MTTPYKHYVAVTVGVDSSFNGSVQLGHINIRGQIGGTGRPTSGTWATGDVVIDQAKVWWLCTAGGTPGSWV